MVQSATAPQSNLLRGLIATGPGVTVFFLISSLNLPCFSPCWLPLSLLPYTLEQSPTLLPAASWLLWDGQA